LRGWQGNASVGGELGRAEARTRGVAGGGGHQHDRIIGKMAKAHCFPWANSELSSPI
jgi:hypothetical protein